MKINKILTKETRTKIRNKKIKTKVEASTTKRTNLYFLGQERHKKKKKKKKTKKINQPQITPPPLTCITLGVRAHDDASNDLAKGHFMSM